MAVAVKNLTRRQQAPRAAFNAIATKVLPGWDISLAFVGLTKARALNNQLRGKDYVPNVLSYRTGVVVSDEALAKSGEIIICPAEAKKQAADFSMTERDFVLYLFIHGLLHLKGWVHGATMEECERNLVGQFSKDDAYSLIHVTTHRHRHRHRHLSGKNSRC